jgi:hypothetical protein
MEAKVFWLSFHISLSVRYASRINFLVYFMDLKSASNCKGHTVTALSANFEGKLAAQKKSFYFVSQKSVLHPSPVMEVTEIILAKVSRLCQLSSRGFLSRI